MKKQWLRAMNEYSPISGPDPGKDEDGERGALLEHQAAEWQLAERAANLLAVNPTGLRGIHLCGPASPALTRYTEYVQSLLPSHPRISIAHTAAVAQLDEQLDLVATVAAGKPIMQVGLSKKIRHGLLVLPQASLLGSSLCSALSRAIDQETESAVLALDESDPDEAGLPEVLSDRMGLVIRLGGQCLQTWSAPLEPASAIIDAKDRLSQIKALPDDYDTASSLAAALGVRSMRAPYFLLQAARANAALESRPHIEKEDFSIGVQFVLLPRATQMPSTQPPPEEQDAAEQEPQQQEAPDTNEQQQNTTPGNIKDIVEAAQAIFQPDLPTVVARNTGLGQQTGRRNPGKRSKHMSHGRPVGVRRGRRDEIRRLSMRDTLVAAATKQTLRAAIRARTSIPQSGNRPVKITTDDFRVLRRSAPRRVTTIFVVDASGSHAVGRLAEAKGAALAMLQSCYERRDRVAVICFGGDSATTVLAPTPAPARAAKELHLMPSGGGTPLASALLLTQGMVRQVTKEGDTPFLVLLTDGKANIALNGQAGRTAAAEDAKTMALATAALGIDCFLIDTGRRPSPPCQELASNLNARYLHLHRIPPAVLHGELKTATHGIGPRAVVG